MPHPLPADPPADEPGADAPDVASPDALAALRAALALQRAIAGRHRFLGAGPPPDDPPPDDDVPDLFGTPAPADEPARSPYERIAALVPPDSPLAAMDSLGEIYDWLARTVLIPLDETRIKPVLGTGREDADLMIVGEAPGADEDRTGEPFVGRAGQLLNKILAAVGFEREEVYITNILKSRPPNNRDPEPSEVAAHLPILHRQIAIVQPRVILAVGKSAGNGLLGRQSSLASLRGKAHDFHGLPLYVTYHPAALLRNEQWKRPTWEDVKLMRTHYDRLVGAAGAGERA